MPYEYEYEIIPTQANEARQMVPSENREFEQAIEAWEKRTGRKVERTFSSGVVVTNGSKKSTEYDGSEWKNFAMFLGSREAAAYRKNKSMPLKDAISEWVAMNVSDCATVKEY